MKKTTIIILSLILFLVLCIETVCILLSLRAAKDNTNAIKLDENFDYAAQCVFESKLMKNCNYSVGESTISITGYYYDGLRLYICLSSDGLLTKDSVKDFTLLSNNNNYYPSLIALSDDVELVAGEKANLLIFNSLKDIDLQNMILSFQKEYDTECFGIENTYAESIDYNAHFDEIALHSVMFGKTSTYMKCDIIEKIEGTSFQAVVGDVIIPIYVISNEDYCYEFLLPIDLNITSTFDFVSNNANGVELRVPIDFTNAIVKDEDHE